MTGSITQFVKSLPDQPDESTTALWHRYSNECREAAERLVSSKLQRAVDTDQIAMDAFYCFCRKVADGSYPELTDRDAIWALLSTMIKQEAGNQVRKERRVKRGGGDQRGESVFVDSPGGLAEQCAETATPESIALSNEQVSSLLTALPDDLRKIAQWKQDGESNVTIARRLGCDPTTIKYRLDKIARLWAKMQI